MGKKTIIPLGLKEYKVVTGNITVPHASTQTVTFDGDLIGMWASVKHKQSGTSRSSLYALNETNDFWIVNNVSLTDLEFPQHSVAFYASSTVNLRLAKASDNSVNFTNTASTSEYTASGTYIALIEVERHDIDLYLLNGIILYTDGTPTSDVTDSIKTISTNQYKIKNDALIHITGATYVNVSN